MCSTYSYTRQPPDTAKPIVDTPTPSGTPPSATPTTCVPQSNYIVRVCSSATIVRGTTDIGVHCDDCIVPISLPFPITVYGQSFSSANVSSNGNVQFVSSNPAPGEDVCMPQVAFNYVILAYLADLD